MEKEFVPISIRVHTDLPLKGISSEKKKNERESFGQRILVFDTETTIDQYQNLLFGQTIVCEGARYVHIDGQIKEKYLFYGEAISPEELLTLEEYSKRNGFVLLSRNDFVEKIFLPEITLMGSVCVGFNLPFDLSRLAIKTRTYQRGKYKDDIELFFDKRNSYLPTITVNSLDSKRAFIKLRNSTMGKPASPNIPYSKAVFLDLRTLVFSLTSKSMSLAKACQKFKTIHQKIEAEGHGKITQDYLAYNTNDVLATLDLYCETVKEFFLHPVEKTPAEVFSPASVGKAYFEAMGIVPLREKRPDFPPEVLGYSMSSYYGGRAECHYRRKSVKAFHVDIMSMYPSVFVLQGLWQWIITDKLEIIEATEEIQGFLDSILIEDLFRKETWKQIPVLVAIRPHEDLLPVRAEYVANSGYQIGLNYLTCDKLLWYTLADLVVSKILSGKIPKVERAIRIIPGPPQDGLKAIKLRGQRLINPEDDLFKALIEMRQEEKNKITESDDEHDMLQYFMKIFANSTSYGINVEANRTEFDEPVSATIYGIEEAFTVNCEQLDVPGKYYNPLVATMITGAAHLILAMIEACVLESGGNYAFCDTDSLDIIDLVNGKPELIGSQVADRFRSLLPYELPYKNGKPRSLLEAEDYNWERKDWAKDTDEGNINKEKYYPLHCYMISAKRYVLYNLVPDEKGGTKIIIRKKSDHGLGHLNNPIPGKKGNGWVSDLWKYIIAKEHNLPCQEPEWFYRPAFAQFTASKPIYYKMLCPDKDKPWLESIKPFNFGLIAYPKKQKGMFFPVINPYYCRKDKQFKNGNCSNKSKCLYRLGCFANIHVTPIAPFAGNDQWSSWASFDWVDKTTQAPVTVTLSKSHSRKILRQNILNSLKKNDYFGVLNLPNDHQDMEIEKLIRQREINLMVQEKEVRGVIISSYFDMVKDYCEHREAKYNDKNGKPCENNTKELLTRKHLEVKKIRQIGKETNTLQTIEEMEMMVNEQLNELAVLHFNIDDKSGQTRQKDYLESWPEIREILKTKAKPREQWAEGLGITTRHFRRLLTLSYNPSQDIFNKTISLLKAEGLYISVDSTNNSRAVGMGQIFKVKELARDIGMIEQKVKSVFQEWKTILYGIEYIDLSSESAQEIVKEWLKQRKAESKAVKKKVISTLNINGECWNSEAKSYQPRTCAIDQVTHYRVRKQTGKKARRIQILLQDGQQLILKEKPNKYLFKLGLMPRPSKINFDWKNNSAGKSTNNKKYFYSPWYDHNENTIPWIDINRVNNNYSVTLKTFKADIAVGRFPAKAVREENGRIFVNPIVARVIYGKNKTSRETT